MITAPSPLPAQPGPSQPPKHSLLFWFPDTYLTSRLSVGVIMITRVCVCVFVAQLFLTLCDPMDCSQLGSSVHGILHARILEWVAILFTRRSSWPKDQTQVFCIAGRFFTVWATREAHDYTWRLYSLGEHRKKEKHRSLEIGLESCRLKKGFIIKISYCHSYLRRREKY